MPTIYTEVEVDVDLDDFDSQDLIDELASRDIVLSHGNLTVVQRLFEAQQLGKDIKPLLNELYWNVLGRVV